MEGRRKRSTHSSPPSNKKPRSRRPRGSPDRRTQRMLDSKNGKDISDVLQPVDAKGTSVTVPSTGTNGSAKDGCFDQRTDDTWRATSPEASIITGADQPLAVRPDSAQASRIATAGPSPRHDAISRDATAFVAQSNSIQSPGGSGLKAADVADVNRAPESMSLSSPRRAVSSLVMPVPLRIPDSLRHTPCDSGGISSHWLPSPDTEGTQHYGLFTMRLTVY
ncbi:uncharacterized protein LOC144129729 [Amblyomma americanum]